MRLLRRNGECKLRPQVCGSGTIWRQQVYAQLCAQSQEQSLEDAHSPLSVGFILLKKPAGQLCGGEAHLKDQSI